MRMDGTIAELAGKHENFYLYDEKSIIERTGILKENFPSVDFLYSVKCNSDHNVVRSVFSQGLGADAASFGEVILSERCGLSKDRIYYSAPGKTDREIEGAVGRCVLIADSLSEIERIRRIWPGAEIGVRINPDFTFRGEGGVPSKFGIDEKELMSVLPGIEKDVHIAGIHVHIKSQELNSDALLRYYRSMFALAGRIEKGLGHGLDFINMGSGIGIPYAPGDSELDLAGLGKAVEGMIEEYNHPGTKVIIETGRFAVGKCGTYVTHVVDRKVSCGKTFVILKNTMNGFVRPSLARLVAKYSPERYPASTEPLFTGVDAFGFVAEGEGQEKVTLMGDLCTAADVIAEDVIMPKLSTGDTVMITNAGAYAAVLTPMQFSSQGPVPQLFLTSDGRILE